MFVAWSMAQHPNKYNYIKMCGPRHDQHLQQTSKPFKKRNNIANFNNSSLQKVLRKTDFNTLIVSRDLHLPTFDQHVVCGLLEKRRSSIIDSFKSEFKLCVEGLGLDQNAFRSEQLQISYPKSEIGTKKCRRLPEQVTTNCRQLNNM